jgi:hypothetical protein
MGAVCSTYGERTGAYRVLVETTERDDFKNLGVGGKKIVIWIFKQWNGKWSELMWIRIRTSSGLL